MSVQTSAIRWVRVPAELPDAEMTVLIATPDEDEPVWLGYFDGRDWRTVEGRLVRATHWSTLPEPPPR